MELTSTEKLIIAIAFDLYGYENKQKAFQYIRCSGVEVSDVDKAYDKITKESKTAGYRNPVDYCEDLRYVKGLQKLKEYKELLFQVLENRIDLEDIDISSEEDYNIGKQSFFDDTKYKDKYQENFLEHYNDTLHRIENQSSEQLFQIEPRNLNRSVSKTSKNDSPKDIKDRKRFYMKMNEEERLIDDYFDYLDVKRNEDKIFVDNTALIDKFPSLSKNIAEIPLKKTVEIEHKDSNIKNQFDFIMNKVKNLRKQEKDRSQWNEEIKIIIEYAISLLGHKEDFIDIYNKVNINNIPGVIMNILMKIQDIIMETEDKTLLSICLMLKKSVAAFGDYYKK